MADRKCRQHIHACAHCREVQTITNEHATHTMAVDMVIMIIHIKQNSAALPSTVQCNMTHAQVSYATFSQVCLSHIHSRYMSKTNVEAAAKPFASSCCAICLKHYGPTLKDVQPECIAADISGCIPGMSNALCWYCPAATHEQWRSRGRGRGWGRVGGQNESGKICVRI